MKMDIDKIKKELRNLECTAIKQPQESGKSKCVMFQIMKEINKNYYVKILRELNCM